MSDPQECSVTLQGHALEGVWTEGPEGLVKQKNFNLGGIFVQNVQVTLNIPADVTLWAILDAGQSEMDIKIVHCQAGEVRQFSMQENFTDKPAAIPAEVWDFATNAYDGYIAGW